MCDLHFVGKQHPVGIVKSLKGHGCPSWKVIDPSNDLTIKEI